MSNFLDLEGLRSYHSKLVSLIKSLAGGVFSFKGRTGEVVPQDGDYNAFMVGAVPDTRTINGKRLNQDITITKDDIEGLDSLVTPDLSGYVPTSRKVNGKALSSDISLSASDVSAVPTSRTVNGKALSSDISLSATDVSALSSELYLLPDMQKTWIESYPSAIGIPCNYNLNNYSMSLTTLRNYIKGATVGKSMAGQSVLPNPGGYVPAGEGAEIFNDYRERIYGGSSGTDAQAGNVATGKYSHAEGALATASGSCSHAEGEGCEATRDCAHAEGLYTNATGAESHAEGFRATSSGGVSHAEGYDSIASGEYSHAEGRDTKASGLSSHAGGFCTISSAQYQTAIGSYNVESNNNSDKFIIGKGTNNARSNCFRVTDTGTFASGSYNSSGADYAELFEWLDGNVNNEGRIGLFVTLDGEYIRLANPTDKFILGVVSGNPSVVGDVHDDQWQGMYLYDIYGRPIWEDVEVPDETIEEPDPEDPTKTITRVLIPAHIEHRQKLNPDYDNTQTYIPRTKRKEWTCVGMMGKLIVRDDGSCEVNGYVKVGDGGKASRSETETKYRMISRIDGEHIKVLILANS